MTGPLPPPSSVAFFGTPDIAVPMLRTVVDAGVAVPLVVTRSDARRGRRAEPTPSPVKAAAIDLGLPVAHDMAAVLDVDVDLALVVAYGRIIPAELLAAIPMVNVHYSLLPRWRGAAPVERAILAGDDTTGVCLMEVAEALDAGAVYRSAAVPITPTTTADDLEALLTVEGAELLHTSLMEGFPEPVPQVGEPTYADKIVPADLRLDWDRPAVELLRVVRVGGAWTTTRGKRLKIHSAQLRADDAPTPEGRPGTLAGSVVSCGRGSLELGVVQLEGKGRVAATAWLSGARLAEHAVLGD